MYEIWGSHGGEDIDRGLPGCEAVWLQMFRIALTLKMEAINSSETFVDFHLQDHTAVRVNNV
jgi:hypothetical protein